MLSQVLQLMRTELLLVAGILLLLILKLGKDKPDHKVSLIVCSLFLLAALIPALIIKNDGSLFGSMYVTNDIIRFEKNILLLSSLLIVWFSYNWIKSHEHGTEYLMLMLSTVLGMCYMISAANLLMFYLGLELSTIPLAAMAAFDLHRNRSAEAAFKMIIASAFSSCLLLFGLSWLYGSAGSLQLNTISSAFVNSPIQLFALAFIIAGIGFKISAVPFHLWTADVYEGAPVTTTAFLSVASKAAVLFASLQLLYQTFAAASQYIYVILCILAALTMLTGNLFALQQQNIKRLLAFSSITQIGFILLGLSAQNEAGSSSLLFFLLIYMFSNLAAFGVAAVVEHNTGADTVGAFRGLYYSNPRLSWLMAIALFSLAGIPPTAGFFGKLFLLLAAAGKLNWWLIVFAALNMMMSLYYYLRIVKAMFVDEASQEVPAIVTPWPARISLLICLSGILVTGLYAGAYEYIRQLFT